jgi:hypothetical protein
MRYDIQEALGLVETLIYEASRIFRDRLVDKQSKLSFDKTLYAVLKERLDFQDRLRDTYFISKVVQGTTGLVPGLPPLGRIQKQDFVHMID